MKIKNKILEGIGLILILGSFGWQLIQEELDDARRDQLDYQIHEKLDLLWSLSLDEYTHSELNKSQIIHGIVLESAIKSFEYYHQALGKRKELEAQTESISWIKSVLFAMGSLLIIIAKFRSKEE